MIDLLTFGETMASVRIDGPLRLGGAARLSMAGAESTVAVGLARLGHRVRWVGRVGRDEVGALVLRTLRAESVDVSCAIVDDQAPTGVMLLERRVADRTRVGYYRDRSAGSRLSPADLALPLAEGARVLHVTGITCALGDGPLAAVRHAVEVARAHGWVVCLDVNHRSLLWTAEQAADVLAPLARQATILVASVEELPIVSGAGGAAALLAAGVREVIVKLGADGAQLHTAEGVFAQPAHRIPVLDTVGAGDAFTAGYLSAWLDGHGPEQRLARANATGAFAVASPGDWEGLPTRAELELIDHPAGTTVR